MSTNSRNYTSNDENNIAQTQRKSDIQSMSPTKIKFSGWTNNNNKFIENEVKEEDSRTESSPDQSRLQSEEHGPVKCPSCSSTLWTCTQEMAAKLLMDQPICVSSDGSTHPHKQTRDQIRHSVTKTQPKHERLGTFNSKNQVGKHWTTFEAATACWICATHSAEFPQLRCSNPTCRFKLCGKNEEAEFPNCFEIHRIAQSIPRAILTSTNESQIAEAFLGEFERHFPMLQENALIEALWYTMLFIPEVFEALVLRYLVPGKYILASEQQYTNKNEGKFSINTTRQYTLPLDVDSTFLCSLMHTFVISSGGQLSTKMRDLLLRSCKYHPKLPECYAFFELSETVQRLVDKGDIESLYLFLQMDNKGSQKFAEQALIYVANTGRGLEMLKRLIKDGKVDPSAMADRALRVAASAGHTDVVRVLLADHRVDGNTREWIALRSACSNGHIQVAKLLLDRGYGHAGVRDSEPVRWASEKGQVDVLDVLIATCNGDLKLFQCPKAVLAASSNGHVKTLQKLLSLGNDPTGDSNSALAQAVSEGHWQIVDILLLHPKVRESCENSYCLATRRGHLALGLYLVLMIYSTGDECVYGKMLTKLFTEMDKHWKASSVLTVPAASVAMKGSHSNCNSKDVDPAKDLNVLRGTGKTIGRSSKDSAVEASLTNWDAMMEQQSSDEQKASLVMESRKRLSVTSQVPHTSESFQASYAASTSQLAHVTESSQASHTATTSQLAHVTESSQASHTATTSQLAHVTESSQASHAATTSQLSNTLTQAIPSSKLSPTFQNAREEHESTTYKSLEYLWKQCKALFNGLETEIPNNCEVVLEAAVDGGFCNIVGYILQECPTLHTVDINPYFHTSCELKEYDTAHVFLRDGRADPRYKNFYALSRFVSDERLDLLQLAFDDLRMDLGVCVVRLLFAAIQYDCVDALDFIFQRVRDSNALATIVEHSANNLVMEACMNGNPTILETVCNYFPDSIAQSLKYKAFQTACELGIVSQLQFLVKHDEALLINEQCLTLVCEYGLVSLVRKALLAGLAPTQQALVGACRNGHHGVVEILLQHSGPSFFSGDSMSCALQAACDNEDIQISLRLLRDHDPSCLSNSAIESLIVLACQQDDVGLLNRFLENYPMNQFPDDILQIAAARNSLNVLKILLKTDVTFDCNKALEIACCEESFECVKLLLDDEKVDPSWDRQAALRRAAALGYAKIVELLLHDGRVVINAGDVGETPLELACELGREQVVRYLLKHPTIDPMIHDNSPLELAARGNHETVVKILLDDGRVNPAEWGIGWFLPERQGRKRRFRPLKLAMERLLCNDVRMQTVPSYELHRIMVWACVNRELNLIRALLENERYDPNQGHCHILYIICRANFCKIAKLLLSYDKVDRQTTDMKVSPIVSAARAGSWEMVRLMARDPLVKVGAKNNETFLLACKSGSWETVQMLLDHPGVDPRANSNFAFHTACINKRTRVLRLLLNDTRIPVERLLLSGLESACAAGHLEIVAMLLRHHRLTAGTLGIALTAAVKHGRTCTVQMLINHHFATRSILQGPQVLPVAVQSGDYNTTRLLLTDSRSAPESLCVSAFWECRDRATQQLIFSSIRQAVEFSTETPEQKKLLDSFVSESRLVAAWCLSGPTQSFGLPGDVLFTVLSKWL